MPTRRLATVLAAAGLVGALIAPASAAARPARGPGTGVQGVTAITDVYTYGQKVAAVAVEYSAIVNPRTLDPDTFTVTDSVYNFRYNPIEDLDEIADRTVTRVYTNDEIGTNPDGRSRPGRYVIVELAPTDPGGNTVMVSRCPTALCTVKVNPDLPTEVVQNENVYARPGHGAGHGRLLARGSSTSHPLTGETVNPLVDDFAQDTYLRGGMVLPYAYHLPEDYDPNRAYPLVVILPGHGMGWDGDNLGVQLAADIPATAWLRPDRTGTDEDVIVLAPQNQRVGAPAEAALMVALVEDFMDSHAVDPDRVYASTVSYGSTLAWEAMATRPGLFTAALVTGGFRVSADQATRIAADRTPVWITHGTNDHLLPVAYGRDSADLLRDAYVAAGVDPAEAEDLVRYTEYANDAFSEPDYHAAFGPSYEDASILRWLLDR
ncbi:PHB depolymerase family esterase [Streptomyces sp. B6B3]|uniref:PHB depolymerase family esterase n=1 Tax=Streptomyces sp. B6B3 TaxID=3153570 RepID=UPI00325D1907